MEIQWEQVVKDEKRLSEAKDFPNSVLIDTISFCNLRCSMCGHKNMKRKPAKMEEGLVYKILDEIAEKKPETRVWMTYFGEALILKDKLIEYIRYAKDKGLKDVVFNSNGQLLTKEMSRKLLEAGLDGIYVGIDAFSEETYKKLRVGGKYDKVVANVSTFLEMEKRMNIKPTRMYVQFVEMNENRHEIEPFTDYWSEKGAIVKIRPMVSWAGAITASNLDPKMERFPCYWVMQNISITTTGDVALCAIDIERAFYGGSVQERSIEDVWKNGPLSEIRQMHLKGGWERLPFLCRECLDWQSACAVFKEKKNN